MHRILSYCIFVLLAVSACTTPKAPATRLDTAYLKGVTQTSASVRAYMTGKTTRSFSTGHGTQVAYTAPGGVVYLWYPGNSVVLTGQWKIEQRDARPWLCFRYGANSYNPVTGQPGGDYECAPAAGFIGFDYERVEGDPFRLQDRNLPFVLPKGRNIPFADLVRRAPAGVGPLTYRRTPRSGPA